MAPGVRKRRKNEIDEKTKSTKNLILLLLPLLPLLLLFLLLLLLLLPSNRLGSSTRAAGPAAAVLMPGATDGRRAALEAARGALLAAHAASGLAAGQSRSGTRLLRAAEGLLRAAVAELAAPLAAQPAQADAAAPGTPPPRRRRPRGRRGRRSAGAAAADGGYGDDDAKRVVEERGQALPERARAHGDGADGSDSHASMTNDDWADDLPPRASVAPMAPGRAVVPARSGQTLPERARAHAPPALSVGMRARISRGPFVGQLVDIESVDEDGTSVRFVVDGIAEDVAPMKFMLNFLEVVGDVRGPGLVVWPTRTWCSTSACTFFIHL